MRFTLLYSGVVQSPMPVQMTPDMTQITGSDVAGQHLLPQSLHARTTCVLI
jgi:hypothetical protein